MLQERSKITLPVAGLPLFKVRSLGMVSSRVTSTGFELRSGDISFRYAVMSVMIFIWSQPVIFSVTFLLLLRRFFAAFALALISAESGFTIQVSMQTFIAVLRSLIISPL